MKRLFRDDKAVALPSVIITMTAVVIFGMSILLMSTNQVKTNIKYENNVNALHVAEAGINHYLWYLNKESAAFDQLNTVIEYPEYNPAYAYIIEVDPASDSPSSKKIRSTGWLLSDPDNKRVIEVVLAKKSFTQYVYFSDNDPSDILFTSSDFIYGPYHSNTNLVVSGRPTFFGKATYSGQLIQQSGANPDFRQGVEKVPRIEFLEDNKELKALGQNSDGYYYSGRTCIMLNSNGTATILNNGTRTTRNLPANGVIYVDGSGVSVNDKFNTSAGNVFISGTLKGRLTVAAANDIYITDYDPTRENFNTARSYPTGGLTYANTDFYLDTASGEVTVTGDGKDLLGLVANRHIGVLTRGWFNDPSANSLRAGGLLRVYAAVFSINGSFGNSMNYNGYTRESYPVPASTLMLRGAIIQKERGVVGILNGSTVNGFMKSYAHDPRLHYDAPPHFLVPNNSGWEIYEWNEI